MGLNPDYLLKSFLLYLVCVPFAFLVVTIGLEEDDNKGHGRFDDTKLQRGLLTKTQKSNVVRVARQTARSIHTAGF